LLIVVIGVVVAVVVAVVVVAAAVAANFIYRFTSHTITELTSPADDFHDNNITSDHIYN